MNILLTGSAGFIGFHTAKRLLQDGHTVIGVDNFNNYYNPQIKEDRNHILKSFENYKIYRNDISNFHELEKVFQENKIDKIINLAAQAGVRYSLENPFAYEIANNIGFLNVLELAKKYHVKDVIYASSSSVYGGNKKNPFSIKDNVDKPISLYAATKKYNELIAHVYHHLYGMNTTGLRFFTVYGPFGRPDMALFKFVKAILEDKEIDVYNFGDMRRDFTYVTDIVDGIVSAMEKSLPCAVFNLGNSNTVKLTYFIECIEKELGKKSRQNLLPIQPGDVPETSADITESKELLEFDPKVNVEQGIKEFIRWYKGYYNV